MTITFIYAAIIGYLLGTIPFGLLVTRSAGLGDIRSIGSGNIGATNVLRTGRRELAAATLILDAAKGAAAVLIARYFWGPDTALIAGLAAFAGHIWPIWLKFKGGKGTATFIGVLFGLAWPVALVFCAVWLVIALAQRYSSLAALTAAVTSPIFSYVIGLYDPAFDSIKLAATTAVMALTLVYTHRANIGRLLNNTEPKIGSEKSKAP